MSSLATTTTFAKSTNKRVQISPYDPPDTEVEKAPTIMSTTRFLVPTPTAPRAHDRHRIQHRQPSIQHE